MGFIANELRASTQLGEVHLLAVHPEHQNRGSGTRLNDFALDKMRYRGMVMAEVGDRRRPELRAGQEVL